MMGGVTEIYSAILASPPSFRSISLTGLGKAIPIFIERRGFICMHRQGYDLIFGISREIFVQGKCIVYPFVVSVIFVSFVLQVNKA
jgi:hypothetical protein